MTDHGCQIPHPFSLSGRSSLSRAGLTLVDATTVDGRFPVSQHALTQWGHTSVLPSRVPHKGRAGRMKSIRNCVAKAQTPRNVRRERFKFEVARGLAKRSTFVGQSNVSFFCQAGSKKGGGGRIEESKRWKGCSCPSAWMCEQRRVGKGPSGSRSQSDGKAEKHGRTRRFVIGRVGKSVAGGCVASFVSASGPGMACPIVRLAFRSFLNNSFSLSSIPHVGIVFLLGTASTSRPRLSRTRRREGERGNEGSKTRQVDKREGREVGNGCAERPQAGEGAEEQGRQGTMEMENESVTVVVAWADEWLEDGQLHSSKWRPEPL